MVSLTERTKHYLDVYRLILGELWSGKHHANSFRTTRAGYIRSRTSNICYGWALLVLLWIPLDILLVSENTLLRSLIVERVILAAALFSIGWYCKRQSGLEQARFCLFLLVVCVNLFYVSSNLLLAAPDNSVSFETAYALLPIIHVVMLTIFPLSAVESLALMAITAISHLAVEYRGGNLLSPDKLSAYWLQTVLSVIVIWSQLSQLHMILRLYRQATLDPLTGVYNRRMLLQLADKALYRCQSKGIPFSVLLLDLDKFKRINDKWGHACGDIVLQTFTRTLQADFRKSDIFGRFGGEEFVVFLPGCDARVAQQVAIRILSVVRRTDITVDDEPNQVSITVSIGVATHTGDEDLSALIERADHALYKAKADGRDRSVYMMQGEKFDFEKRNLSQPTIEKANQPAEVPAE